MTGDCSGPASRLERAPLWSSKRSPNEWPPRSSCSVSTAEDRGRRVPRARSGVLPMISDREPCPLEHIRLARARRGRVLAAWVVSDRDRVVRPVSRQDLAERIGAKVRVLADRNRRVDEEGFDRRRVDRNTRRRGLAQHPPQGDVVQLLVLVSTSNVGVNTAEPDLVAVREARWAERFPPLIQRERVKAVVHD